MQLCMCDVYPSKMCGKKFGNQLFKVEFDWHTDAIPSILTSIRMVGVSIVVVAAVAAASIEYKRRCQIFRLVSNILHDNNNANSTRFHTIYRNNLCVKVSSKTRDIYSFVFDKHFVWRDVRR